MPSLNEYGRRHPDRKVGDLVQLKRRSQFAHLTDTLRLGKVERVEPSRLLVRLKHASFWLHHEDLVGS
jgi:hypothetical protein